MNIDELSINTIRMLSLDAVQKANSGHPGLPLGAAPMAYVLWTRFLRFNPKNPHWPDRDRFVLSAGHGSALLYSLLHLTGFDLSLDELKTFRQWKSKTPGHPEYLPECGIETTTGPLGQGFANGVGMAIAERHMAAVFNRPGHALVNHFTYAIVSDGDLMEGIASEAASLAGHLRLGKLIYLYDSNLITLSGETRLTFTEDVAKRFESYGWQVLIVKDGNDIEEIESAVTTARADDSRPSLITVRTHIGYGSPKQDTFGVHGSPLSKEDVIATKKNYGWPTEHDFHIPDEALAHMRKPGETGARLEEEWKSRFTAYAQKYPDLKAKWELMMSGQLPDEWNKDLPAFSPDAKGIATRAAGGKVLNSAAKYVPSLIGGSADLDPSTNTALKDKGSFQPPPPDTGSVQGAVSGPWGYEGANISFGVREHGMGAILNGVAQHGGLIPYGSTFLIFSDYMRPAIRLAALSKLHVIYIFTHDSVFLGEDGPTHQPVEHLSSLRAMPGLVVIRPADANETVEAWRIALLRNSGPVVLIFTRQNVPVIDRTKYASADGLKKGGYVLADSSAQKPALIIIATGSEVHLALGVYERLVNEGVAVRVVSLPSWELFEEQDEEYRDHVIPPHVTARLTIEAGSTHGWHKYAGSAGEVIGIDRFGASAPAQVVLEKFGFTVEHIYQKAKKQLNKS
ncbi:MAG: transketolase [Nitrospirae bacterium]|nr:transketolase [Nitrospirota bacterium]